MYMILKFWSCVWFRMMTRIQTTSMWGSFLLLLYVFTLSSRVIIVVEVACHDLQGEEPVEMDQCRRNCLTWPSRSQWDQAFWPRLLGCTRTCSRCLQLGRPPVDSVGYELLWTAQRPHFYSHWDDAVCRWPSWSSLWCVCGAHTLSYFKTKGGVRVGVSPSWGWPGGWITVLGVTGWVCPLLGGVRVGGSLFWGCPGWCVTVLTLGWLRNHLF